MKCFEKRAILFIIILDMEIKVLSEEENLIEIKKSKFYAFTFNVFSEEDVENKLQGLKREYADARHICYAYILSSPKKEKCSDDKEPSGTAGMPILNVLKRQNLENMMIVVIRYFGGIKLGAGGLTRAYSSSAVEVVNKCRVKIMQKAFRIQIICDFQNKKDIERILNKDAQSLEVDYSKMSENKVIYSFKVLEEEKDLLTLKLNGFQNMEISVLAEELIEK